MKSKALRKTPADYPQMIFRINQEDKDRVTQLIDLVTNLANESKPEDWKKFRKNDVIIDALLLGLLTLEKRYSTKMRKS
jgi:hypothetical protein